MTAILLPVGSIALLTLAGELALRAWHLVRWDISFFEGLPRNAGSLSPLAFDSELGWRPTPNYRFRGHRRSADGSRYAITLSQDEHGFRTFGNPDSSRPKVFIVGDSFTQAVDVSDDKTYYARLSEVFGVEAFAYGGGGYGSLQEFMVLDQFYDIIKPALIIWQYSTNDLVNNLPELESASTFNGTELVRPYLHGGRILYSQSTRRAATARQFALRSCRVCYVVLNRFNRLNARVSRRTIETETSPGEPGHDLFRQAVSVTDRVMEMVRTRAGGTPIVAFIVGAGDPYGPEYVEALTEISRRHGIGLIDVEGPLLNAEGEGVSVRAEDQFHWNETGHRLAGEALMHSLRVRNLLPPQG